MPQGELQQFPLARWQRTQGVNEGLFLVMDVEKRIRGLRRESAPFTGSPGKRKKPGPEEVGVGQVGKEFHRG